MNAAQIVHAAIPDASKSLVEHIVWGRTPFPFAACDYAKVIYKAASGWRRAGEHGMQLCEMCHRPARKDVQRAYLCARCDAALSGAGKE